MMTKRAVFLMSMLSVSVTTLAGCSHAQTDQAAQGSDRRIASYQDRNNLVCTIRRPDGSLFTEVAPAEKDRVRDLCRLESASRSDCSGDIYCKRALDPAGDNVVQCSIPNATEPYLGLGLTADEALEASRWSCLQKESYERCGSVVPSCGRLPASQ
jgi:hypothetical protein